MACKECGGNGGHHKPGCGMSPAVLQINNKDCTLFHSVTIPAIMGDETENPPTNGLYKNVLLYYEANGNAYFYSSDGIPTKLTYATTDYNALTNKPTINGVTLEGNQSSSSLGININDATLTIKQGDTTLGTFSANASENVEVDIPGSGEDVLSVTLSISDAGLMEGIEAAPPFYGVILSDASISSGKIYGSQVYSSAFVPTITNDETSETMTIEELFDELESGRKIVFNSVPIGWYTERFGATIVKRLIDGVSTNASYSYTDEHSTYTVYSGVVSVSTSLNGHFCDSLPLGFSITKAVNSDTNNTFYLFFTQGLVLTSAPD